MEVLVSSQYLNVGDQTRDWMPPAPTLDGEVRSASEILDLATNPANAGKSYYMRGGSYGALTVMRARPASLITFIVYPGEQVAFTDVYFAQTINLRFDGNPVNTLRGTSTRFPNGSYGLLIRGTGVLGYDLPPVPTALIFADTSATEGNANIQLANFRLGDVASIDPPAAWRRQHGVVFTPFQVDILFEDFEISYIGADLADFASGGAGDFEGGGFAMFWIGASDTSTNFTFRRGHIHNTYNDFIQYGPANLAGQVRYEHCLFEDLFNHGDSHADFVQIYGGTTPLTFEGCVWRNGSDYLLHGNNPGGTRLFSNCLFDKYHQIVMSKDNESGPSDYEYRNCTLIQPDDGTVPGLRTDSVNGAAWTSNCVVTNSILKGIISGTGINVDAVYSNEGAPNLITRALPGITGDIYGTPVLDDQRNCLNYPQGWRKPPEFPWTLPPSESDL